MEAVFESVETFTADEFERFVEERRRRADLYDYELLHGRIVMNPPAGWPHGSVEIRLASQLDQFVRTQSLGYAFGPSQGFLFPSGDIVGPDASFVSNARWRTAPPPEHGRFLRVVPDVVFEIVSPSNASRDRGEKFAIYERNGVLEYWMLDPLARRLSLFVHESDQRFAPARIHEADQTAASEVLQGFSLRLLDLLPDALAAGR